MTRLPVVSGKQLIRVLQKLGYYIRDQKGSHIHMRHPTKIPITIPNHKEIAKGTLRTILLSAELNHEEFIKLSK